MKTYLLLLLLSLSALAHEGGHGQIAEKARFGGLTAPVFAASDAGNPHAPVLYKAELVRAESGKLSLYLYSDKMVLLEASAFDGEVEAKLEVKKKGKFTYVGTFKLARSGKLFVGQLPQIDYKPFNIDMTLTSKGQKLFVGFTNLD